MPETISRWRACRIPPGRRVSFLGRYRVIDFQISNMSNSGIDHMQVYIRRKPPVSDCTSGNRDRHYNINSKRGRLRILYAEMEKGFSIYSTDIASYIENMESIEDEHYPYVIVAPSYMIFTQDYSKLLDDHIASGADITLLYHSVDNAKEFFPELLHPEPEQAKRASVH